MNIATLIWALASGSIAALAAGKLATILLPGKQRVGTAMLLLIGSAAGVIAGIISGIFDLDDGDGIEWWAFGISVALSMLAVFLWTNWKSNKMEAVMTPKPRSEASMKPGSGASGASKATPKSGAGAAGKAAADPAAGAGDKAATRPDPSASAGKTER